MNNIELTNNALAYLEHGTCYLKGFWGQSLTQAEYNRVLVYNPSNAKYGNTKYIGTGVYPFDCICFIKALLGGATVDNRITYNQLKANPVGDCNNETFLKMLQNNSPCSPKDAKHGYGLATKGHCAIALGNGRWIDANWNKSQNGVAVHETGIEMFTVAGKINGVDYLESVNVGDIIPMTVTRIDGNKAYGEALVASAGSSSSSTNTIDVGSVVKIKKGAKSGGSNPKYKGLTIDEKYANEKYTDIVDEISTQRNEARLKNIVTWVSIKDLILA